MNPPAQSTRADSPPRVALWARFASRAGAALRPFVALIVVAAIFVAIPPHHAFTLMDLRLVAVHTIIVGTAAIGAALVIASGGLDLSIGSAIALTSVVAALALHAGWPLPLAGACAILAGVACGAYNGMLVTALRLPPFIVTLGTLGLYRGLAKWTAGPSPVSADPGDLALLVHPIPPSRWMLVAPGVWLMLALGLLMIALIRSTVLGRHAIAIGSNETAARYAGLPVARTKILLYAIAGSLVGLAGLLQFARITQGDPTIAVGIELDVIAAVVIGGASLSGGRAPVLGAIVGAFMMAYMKNRCARLEWQTYTQEIIVGHIIIVAVAIDLWRRRRSV